MKPEKITSGDSSPPLPASSILWVSLTLPFKNPKLMISNMLLVLTVYSLLALGLNLTLSPVTSDMNSKAALLPKEDPTSPEGQETVNGLLKDSRELLRIELAFMVPLFIISLYSLVTVVSSSAVTYHDKALTLGAMLSDIKWAWKGPAITSLYIIAFTVAYLFVIVFSTIVSMLIIKGAAGIVLIAVVVILTSLHYLYLMAVWMVSLVASVLEEDCYGMEAIKKARELTKGRRLQGFALVLIISVVSFVVVALVNPKQASGSMVQTVMAMFIGCLFKMIMFMVFTVFYYDCKKSSGEEVVVVPGTKGYTMILAVEAI
ncbi:hypothetical protein QJS04_geneDACA013830 [Acorus gramineus]|uniref:Uncharacterized protein n=1 Tax=Acorus gramineus TaxID=55184 RepID=A0AAV9AY44_ACOGR|nr:hypothetical protein QJS04_geneDACA013830 [Acorus gramineus]